MVAILGITAIDPRRPHDALADPTLPDRCYYELPDTRCVLLIRGRAGYLLPTEVRPGDAALLNEVFKVSKAQAECMWAGATLGWNHPSAHTTKPTWRKR